MQFTHITDGTRAILTAAAVEMAVLKHEAIYTPHLLLAYSVRTTALSGILRRQGLTTERLREVIGDTYPKVDIAGPIERYAPEVVYIVNAALEWVKDDGTGARRMARPDHVFIKLIESEDAPLCIVLDELGADRLQMLHEAELVRVEIDRKNTRDIPERRLG